MHNKTLIVSTILVSIWYICICIYILYYKYICVLQLSKVIFWLRSISKLTHIRPFTFYLGPSHLQYELSFMTICVKFWKNIWKKTLNPIQTLLSPHLSSCMISLGLFVLVVAQYCITLSEVKLSFKPVCPSVGRSVGLTVIIS